MSWYYSYYIGIMDKKGKIKPVGPYDADGNLKSVVCNSASFESDLHNSFISITDDMVTEEFQKDFCYENENGFNVLDLTYLSYLPIEKLGSSRFVKEGYFLISDVEEYRKNNNDPYDLFHDCITPEIYAARAKNEMVFGPPKEQKDEYGYNISPHSASEYMFFAYPDFGSREYDVHMLKNVADMLLDEYKVDSEESQIVIILSQG